MPRLTSACFLGVYLTSPAQPPAWASWRHFHPLGCPMQRKMEKCQHKAKSVVVSHTFNVSQINAFHTQTKIATVFHVALFVNNPIWRWLPKSWFKVRCKWELTKPHTRLCLCLPSGGELSLALHRMTQEPRAGWVAAWWMGAHKQGVQSFFRNLTIINGHPSEGDNRFNCCCCLIAKSCPTLCDPMNRSTPGLPVYHQLPEFTQTHVHRVGDPSSHLILCRPLLLLPPIPPSIRVFSNESALHIRWPKYWCFSFSISPSNEHPGLISFRMDCLDLPEVQGTLKSLLQHHSSKASILWCSAFFTVQLSHPYIP